MTFQEQSNGYAAFKVQSAKGTQATGSGATQLRATGGAGAQITKNTVKSGEIRQDGMSERGRHGSQRAAATYNSEMSIGSFDDIIEAVMRGTWGAALSVTNATGAMSSASLSVQANSITASAGSWITAGFRVGDVVRAPAGLVAGNLNRNLRITGLTATVMTVAETLTVEAGPIATWTIERPGGVLINPAAGSLVKRYFTIEEHEQDIDASEIFTDCVWGSLKFTMQPDGLLLLETNLLGTGAYETKTGVNAPHFSSPSKAVTVPLGVVDSTIRLGTDDLLDVSAFELMMDIGPVTPPSLNKVASDVMLGGMRISGSITALREDLSEASAFLNETQMSLHVLATEPESEPKDFFSLFVPNFTLGSVDKSAFSNDAGARTQTLQIPSDLVGVDNRGGAYDATMIKLQRSNS